MSGCSHTKGLLAQVTRFHYAASFLIEFHFAFFARRGRDWYPRYDLNGLSYRADTLLYHADGVCQVKDMYGSPGTNRTFATWVKAKHSTTKPQGLFYYATVTLLTYNAPHNPLPK